LVKNLYGGEILKTRVSEENHFYNIINSVRYDFTDDQFTNKISYLDMKTDYSEIYQTCTKEQYLHLYNAFLEIDRDILICQFLDNFYTTISFKKNEKFKSQEFKNLFNDHALLIETIDNKIKTKSIDDHIKEFENAIINHPKLFINGFKEKQLTYEIMSSDNYIQIKSHYEKNYTRNGKLISEVGYNMITVYQFENKFEIICIAW
jgi:hypothetical protein